jgi:predicted CxxxxCH...CXXCH cytochrome family protein
MDQGYFSFLYVVSQKMIPHFYVLGFGMEHWVLRNTYGTSAITLKWNMGILLTKVTHGVDDPNKLSAMTSCGNILCHGSGLSNTRLFAGRPRHQRRTQKLASPRSGLPIQPTPGKIRV